MIFLEQLARVREMFGDEIDQGHDVVAVKEMRPKWHTAFMLEEVIDDEQCVARGVGRTALHRQDVVVVFLPGHVFNKITELSERRAQLFLDGFVSPFNRMKSEHGAQAVVVCQQAICCVDVNDLFVALGVGAFDLHGGDVVLKFERQGGFSGVVLAIEHQ